MTIEPIDAHRVRISLNADDMRELGITYADMMIGGAPLAPALRGLLEAARTQAGFDAKDKKLLVEFYPKGNGGAILYFTGLDNSPTRYRIKSERLAPCLFRFQDADALVAGCRAVNRQMARSVLCSSLYYSQGFVLAVQPLDTPPSRVFSLLGEYAQCIGKGRLMQTLLAEHAKILLESNAIDVISAQ